MIKKIFVKGLIILMMLILINFNVELKAAGNEFVGQSAGITEQDIKNAIKITDKNINYETNITFISHGLQGSAAHWSNIMEMSSALNSYEFQYNHNSIIECLRRRCNADVYKIEDFNTSYVIEDNQIVGVTPHSFKLRKLIVDSVEKIYKENEYINSITNMNNHIVIIYQSSNETNDKISDFAYKELEFAINKITYDVIQLMETKVKINLIGHSRGGILNMKYAIEYPYNVDGLFSVGTPYNGTNLASIYNLLSSAFPSNSGDPFGLTDLINSPGGSEIISINPENNHLKTAWLNMHEEYSPNINFHAIAGETGITHLIKELIDIQNMAGGNATLSEVVNILFSALIALEQTYISNGITPNTDESSPNRKPYNSQNLNLEEEPLVSTAAFISSALLCFGLSIENEDYLALSELLINCRYSFAEGELFLRSDLFSHTYSQQADGFEFGLNDNIILVNRYKKIFTGNNSTYEMKAANSVGVVHNSETKDLEIINYILLNINISRNDNKVNTCFINKYNDSCLAFMGVVINSTENNVHISLPNIITYDLYGDGTYMIHNVKGISRFFSKSLNNDKVTQISFGNKISIIEQGAFNSFDNVIAFNVDATSEYFCSNSGSLYTKNKKSLIKYCNGSSFTTAFILPNETTNIESFAFTNNNFLTSVDLNNVTMVGEKCFYNASNLASIVGNQLCYAYDFAFHYTEWLDNISNTESTNLGKVLIKYIDNSQPKKTKLVVNQYSCVYSYAFLNSENLVEIIFNTEELLVNRYAFVDNISLERVMLLVEQVFVICPYSFVNNNNQFTCYYLENVYINGFANFNIYRNRGSCVPISRYDLNCRSDVNDFNKNLGKGMSLIYQLDVDCAKSYKITSSSTSAFEMKIYDQNMNLINDIVATISNDELSGITTGTITNYLSPGKYFLKIKYNDSSKSGIIKTNYKATWPVKTYNVHYSDVENKNNILNHLHKISKPISNIYKNELIYANCKGTGFYEIKLTGIKEDGTVINFPEKSIKIYNSADKTELMQKFALEENPLLAKNASNSNTVYVYLTKNTGYYIDIELYDKDFVSLYLDITLANIQEIDIFDLNNLTSNENINITNESDKKGDYVKKIKIKQACQVKLEVEYEGYQHQNVVIILMKIEYDSLSNEQTINLKYIDYLNKDKTTNNANSGVILDLEPGNYYIGYFNLSNGQITIMKLKRIVSNNITNINCGLLPDRSIHFPYGSQLSILEKDVPPLYKSYQGTNITVGFTRLIYLDLDYAQSDSRLDYYWYSSDNAKATITAYATILGRTPGNVTIMAVYKEDPSIIFVKEFTIQPDLDNTPLNIEIYQTHSLSEDGPYQITLTAQNSPYVFLQYYNWSVYVPCQENDFSAWLDAWGNLATTGTGLLYITGGYIINPRISITIYLTLIE